MSANYFEKYGILDNFKEYGAEDSPSILEAAEKSSYPEKEKIVAFLKNNGTVTMVSLKTPKDRVTGERIEGLSELTTREQDVYSWSSDLAYHVEKYNLRLPKKFEDYVLNPSA